MFDIFKDLFDAIRPLFLGRPLAFWSISAFQRPPMTPPMISIHFYHFIYPISIRGTYSILVIYMSGVI